MGISEKLKHVLWSILSRGFRLLPLSVLAVLCRLSYEGISRPEDAERSLVTFLNVNDSLKWYLDRQAIRYGAGTHPKHRLMDYHRFFVDRCAEGSSVLDVGCGNGAVSFSLAEAGVNVTGVDLNPESIRSARQLHDHRNTKYLVADIINDPPAGPFEAVVLSNVLEHINERVTLLRSLMEQYKPEKILIRVPMINRHWEVPLKEELGLFPFSDPTHCTEYTLKSFEEELSAAGLQIRHVETGWGEIWAEVWCRG